MAAGLRLASATVDPPSDHVRDSDGFHKPVGGEFETTTGVVRATEPHRDARADVFDEDLIARIPKNPYPVSLVENREALTIMLVPLL